MTVAIRLSRSRIRDVLDAPKFATSSRMQIQSYRDLEAWQFGMELVVAVYALTRTFPSHERFGLASQLQRAAVSIPSDVSEGHQLGSKAYKHFVTLALGSLAEVSTQIEVACRLQYIDRKQFAAIDQDVSRLRRVLHGLRRSIRIRAE